MNPNIRNTLYLLCLFFFLGTIQAQDSRTVVINVLDTVYKVELCIQNPKKYKPLQKVYAWYKNNKVIKTEAGWAGLLLNGCFEGFYPNQQLLQKGYYENGLKEGKWESWYANGRLKYRKNWKKGQLHGRQYKYSETGKIQVNEQYKKGMLHGKSIYYNQDDSSTVLQYKKGKIVPLKAKKEKIKKIKPIKKSGRSKKKKKDSKKVENKALPISPIEK